MGSQSIKSVLEVAQLDQAILWHLQVNHYPPLPSSLLPACKRAIKLYKQGKTDVNIRLPEGILYKEKKTAPILECMSAWHLYDFVD